MKLSIDHELVWVDGSGVEGTYRAYGFTVVGIHNGSRDARPTVRVINARQYGHRSGRERATCAAAVKAVEARITETMAAVWAAGREYREVAA